MRYVLVAVFFALQTPQAPPPPRSAWLDLQNAAVAEKLLLPETVIVIPLGAGVHDHGRHLPLGTDFYLADRIAHDIMPLTSVVVVPPTTHHLSSIAPAGSPTTTLTMETARDQTVEMVKSLARSGPRRFYVLNIGEGSVRALRNAAAALANEGILLRYADVAPMIGKHGGEPETSAILQIEPKWATMENAEGDAARATAARGKTVLELITATVVQEIEALRKLPPPPVQRAPSIRPNIRVPNVAGRRGVSNCQEGDERAIREQADFFNLRWSTKEADKVSEFWAKEGDLVHPDGTAEHGRETIFVNRREQFMRKEYSASTHTIAFGPIRCISDDVAVVDGKWELSNVFDQAGNRLPLGDGLLTVVMKKQPGGWLFEAYRYTVNQQALRPPTLLKKPGYPDK